MDTQGEQSAGEGVEVDTEPVPGLPGRGAGPGAGPGGGGLGEDERCQLGSGVQGVRVAGGRVRQEAPVGACRDGQLVQDGEGGSQQLFGVRVLQEAGEAAAAAQAVPAGVVRP
jgi:hypothetical protein